MVELLYQKLIGVGVVKGEVNIKVYVDTVLRCKVEEESKVNKDYFKKNECDLVLDKKLPIRISRSYLSIVDTINLEEKTILPLEDQFTLKDEVKYLVSSICRNNKLYTMLMFDRALKKVKLKNMSVVEELLLIDLSRVLKSYNYSFLIIKFNFDSEKNLLRLKVLGLCIPHLSKLFKRNVV